MILIRSEILSVDLKKTGLINSSEYFQFQWWDKFSRISWKTFPPSANRKLIGPILRSCGRCPRGADSINVKQQPGWFFLDRMTSTKSTSGATNLF